MIHTTEAWIAEIIKCNISACFKQIYVWLGFSHQRCPSVEEVSGHAQSSAQQQSMEEKGMASIYRQTFGKNISVRHGECGDEAEAVADPNPHRVVAHTTSYITTLRPGCRLLVSFYSSV